MSNKKYVTNFDILDSAVWVKDTDNYNNVNGKYIAIIGDSNSAGAGWWVWQGLERDETNDGFAPMLREFFNDSTVKNYSVNGAGLLNPDGSGTPQLDEQINQIGGTPDYLIIWLGNNFLQSITTNTRYAEKVGSLQLNEWNNFPTDTIYGQLNNLIKTAKTRYPLCKIITMFRPTRHDINNKNMNYIFASYRKILQKWSVPIIDLEAYLNASYYNSEQLARYYTSATDNHLTETAFRELVGPIVISALLNNCEITSYKNSNVIYVAGGDGTNETQILNAIQQYEQDEPNDTGTYAKPVVFTGSGASWRFGLLFKFKAGSENNYQLVTWQTASGKMMNYRKMFQNETFIKSEILQTQELSAGVDFKTLDTGIYVMMDNVFSASTNKPNTPSQSGGVLVVMQPFGSLKTRILFFVSHYAQCPLYKGFYTNNSASITWINLSSL